MIPVRTHRFVVSAPLSLMMVLVCTACLVLTLSIVGAPIGGEWQANVVTAADQDAPSISMASGGEFAVAWETYGQDGDGYGIYARQYGSAGTPIATEFGVNTNTTGDQRYPCADTDSDSNLMIVWQSPGDYWDGVGYSTLGVYIQRFDSSGTPWDAAEQLVNDQTAGDQSDPAIAVAPNSKHVAVWTDSEQDGSGNGIFGKLLNQMGKRILNFQANTYTTGSQFQPAIAMSDSGDFVVMWNSYTQDGDEGGIYGQRFSGGGAMRGSEFRVNTYAPDDQNSPSVAIHSSGTFMAVWASHDQDGDGYGIFGQRYDDSGITLGSEFQVNSHVIGDQVKPCVAPGSNGSFLVTWSSQSQDGSTFGIYAQQFDSNGSPIGPEFRVNSHASGEKKDAVISADSLGNYVIAWSSYGQDGDGFGIFCQRYDTVAIPEFGEVIVPVTVTLLVFVVFMKRRSKKGKTESQDSDQSPMR
ncbi:MAG: hypothetical protein KKE24_02295 [Candidatus Thermoplasmatota archaeon]|nr:hypothetical protein [Candidatus Thermoplasmatota archaeon]